MQRVSVLRIGDRRRGRATASLAVAVAAIMSACIATADNFVVHGASADRSEAVSRHAEALRTQAFASLLDTHDPADWTVRCEIHLHTSDAAFAEAIGGPPDGARGATSIEFVGEAIVVRRIDLMDDDVAAVPDSLAHELVHVVLADRFTSAPPPRWADEGIAVLFDDDEKQRAHDRDFRAAHRDGMTWAVSELFALPDYPREPHRQRVFYGQSAALIRWLQRQRGSETLIAFLEDAATIGDREAVRKHYGFASLAALERAWLAEPTADLVLD